MAVTLKLVPVEAAASVALRIKQIQQAQAYVRGVASRYDGLKSFEAELEKHGVSEAVKAIVSAAAQPQHPLS